MGVIRFEKEVSVSVSSSRMFKAFILDSHNLFPKLLPQAFKTIELEQGDGGVGTIKVVNLAEGNKHKYARQRVDALDRDNFMCKYTVFEEDYMLDILGSIVYEIKFEDYGNGGSVCKTNTEFHTKVDGDQENFKELEEFKSSVDQAMGLFKIVEVYLLANPDLYA